MLPPQSGHVGILINETATPGSIAFRRRHWFRTYGLPESLIAGDINGDGIDDLVTVSTLPSGISVFINKTSQGEAEPRFEPRVDLDGPQET